MLKWHFRALKTYSFIVQDFRRVQRRLIAPQERNSARIQCGLIVHAPAAYTRFHPSPCTISGSVCDVADLPERVG
jgi:hypothetical protein